MANWYNWQNKKHHALYKEYGRCEESESQITWLDMFFLKEPEKLNKRISKISLRRGKKETKRLVKEFLDDMPEFTQGLED